VKTTPRSNQIIFIDGLIETDPLQFLQGKMMKKQLGRAKGGYPAEVPARTINDPILSAVGVKKSFFVPSFYLFWP
jgi:hypothetical protein